MLDDFWLPKRPMLAPQNDQNKSKKTTRKKKQKKIEKKQHRPKKLPYVELGSSFCVLLRNAETVYANINHWTRTAENVQKHT